MLFMGNSSGLSSGCCVETMYLCLFGSQQLLPDMSNLGKKLSLFLIFLKYSLLFSLLSLVNTIFVSSSLFLDFEIHKKDAAFF